MIQSGTNIYTGKFSDQSFLVFCVSVAFSFVNAMFYSVLTLYDFFSVA